MEKPTNLPIYLLNGKQIEVMPYFLYEVDIFLITENMASLIDSKFFKSNKLLKVDEVASKKHNNYSFVRYITLLGVTEKFVKDNKLIKYEGTR